ncbi:MAG TPA: RsmB/NOP family class I SAM-dependent RNA methyltransferase [Verrucomicrobiae bacterium]|nr:RsmB/NOP family class I SAM-dependent RNA methyltransferase [Verrucomicrobiae bacterium]
MTARRPHASHPDQSEADVAVSTARAVRIAATVIQQSGASSPADQCLRAELKKTRGLNQATSRLAARMVFAYYRWLGWTKPEAPVEGRVREAIQIQERFNREPDTFSDAALIEKSIPAWTADVMPVTAAWVRAIQSEPVLWLRTRPGSGEQLKSTLPHALPGPIPDSLIFEGEEDLFTTQEFQAGDFEIQDITSQIVGWLCAPKPGETWWDACAGEGGKTLHLSALMQNKGLIWASDRAEWRLNRLKQRTARARVFNYRTATWNGSDKLPTKTLFDGVLLDAPCSGLGTWQRNPHARWTTTLDDIRELAELQDKLLQAAARGVKKGGRLIYSVCTLAQAETSRVSERFGIEHPEFALEPFASPLDLAGPNLWLWPQDWRGSGMFVTQWRKRGRESQA